MLGHTTGSGRERGFTLLELLVTIIVIAILAAIALPVFLRQREKAWVAQNQSALANAKLMAEGFYVGDGNGSYAGLDLGALQAEGLRAADRVTLVIGKTASDYCLVAIHTDLPAGHDWKRASVHSETGSPSDADNCSGYAL